MNKSQENNAASILILNSLFRMQITNISNSIRLFEDLCSSLLFAEETRKRLFKPSVLLACQWRSNTGHFQVLPDQDILFHNKRLIPWALQPFILPIWEQHSASWLCLHSAIWPQPTAEFKRFISHKYLPQEKKKENSMTASFINGCQN